MLKLKTIVRAALAGSALMATPALAVITTFAEFSAVGSTSNVRWVNNGTTSTNGTGGSIFSIASQASQVIGTRLVDFSFLQSSIAPFATNIGALLTLNAAAASGNIATVASGFIIQPGIAGSFSFTSVGAIVVGSTFYAPGSNLLTGTFTAATIAGQRGGSSGSQTGSTLGGSNIVYTSDFLTFAPTGDLDFSFSLSAINLVLDATPFGGAPTHALRSFRATAGGSFSSDPAPVVTAVPEPAVWGLMIVGFGMVGLQSRRRRIAVTA